VDKTDGSQVQGAVLAVVMGPRLLAIVCALAVLARAKTASLLDTPPRGDPSSSDVRGGAAPLDRATGDFSGPVAWWRFENATSPGAR
jgi:hypothetical protein